MKKALIGLAALALTATAASAAPYKYKSHHDGYRGERHGQYQSVQVKRSKAHLAWVKRQAWADGHVSFYERLKIRRAERQLAYAIRHSHRYN